MFAPTARNVFSSTMYGTHVCLCLTSLRDSIHHSDLSQEHSNTAVRSALPQEANMCYACTILFDGQLHLLGTSIWATALY